MFRLGDAGKITVLQDRTSKGQSMIVFIILALIGLGVVVSRLLGR